MIRRGEKNSKMDPEKKSPAHLNTCRHSNRRAVVSLIIYRPRCVLLIQRRGSRDAHNETCNPFSSCENENPGDAKTMRG